MSLEEFFGLDAGEGMSEAAFEVFKEKMKTAAAQIANIKKEEGKQKKKEGELVKILSKYVKTSQKKDLVLLISRAIEQNIPANFILAVIILGNEDIKEELRKVNATEFLSLMMPDSPDTDEETKALVFFGEDETLPLKIRIELDYWVKGMLSQAQENPQKMLDRSYDIEYKEYEETHGEEEEEYGTSRKKVYEIKKIKMILIQLVTLIIREFLDQNKITEPYAEMSEFSKFILKGILNKVKELVDNRKMLGL